ncbi:MAG: DUF2089 domain-containing protein [Cellulosilyticaceae bacterium]|uniref:DUF2089 domain-containing protein n=1 Tax=Niameybacter sp. TaxID=2033640 RepID=UPI002FC8D5CB
MHKVLSQCPVCSNPLTVQRLKCQSCQTVIENDFKLSKFEYLSSDQLYFIETFIRCRGSIKEVEKELGISYPTVRAKLDEVIISLGFSPKEAKQTKPTHDLLDALEKGEISADEAISQLKK